MDVDLQVLREKKARLLQQLAEIEVEEQRRAGRFNQVPHYRVLEESAHELGQELSRMTQQRLASEVAATSPATAPCPTCGKMCAVMTSKRMVTSVDGLVDLIEPVAECLACRRAFFPSA